MMFVAAFGDIGGGHFNPAVTIGLATAGAFPTRRIVPYVIAQIAGATSPLTRSSWRLPARSITSARRWSIGLTITLCIRLIGQSQLRRSARSLSRRSSQPQKLSPSCFKSRSSSADFRQRRGGSRVCVLAGTVVMLRVIAFRSMLCNSRDRGIVAKVEMPPGRRSTFLFPSPHLTLASSSGRHTARPR